MDSSLLSLLTPASLSAVSFCATSSAASVHKLWLRVLSRSAEAPLILSIWLRDPQAEQQRLLQVQHHSWCRAARQGTSMWLSVVQAQAEQG